MGGGGGKLNSDPTHVDLSYFTVERVLGVGGYGKVNAIIKKKGVDKGMWYAMKALDKHSVTKKRCVFDFCLSLFFFYFPSTLPQHNPFTPSFTCLHAKGHGRGNSERICPVETVQPSVCLQPFLRFPRLVTNLFLHGHSDGW